MLLVIVFFQALSGILCIYKGFHSFFTKHGGFATVIGAVFPTLTAYIVFRLFLGTINLSTSSTRYKILFCILGIVLSIMVLIIKASSGYIIQSVQKDNTVSYLSSCLFLTTTYALFIPSMLVLTNIDDFYINFLDAFILIIIMAAILLGVLVLPLILIRIALRNSIDIRDRLIQILLTEESS